MIERTKVESEKVVLIYEWCLSVVVFNRRAQTPILLLCSYCAHTMIHKARSITKPRRKLCLTRTLAHLCSKTGVWGWGCGWWWLGARQTEAVSDSPTCINAHSVLTSQYQHHSPSEIFSDIFSFQFPTYVYVTLMWRDLTIDKLYCRKETCERKTSSWIAQCCKCWS